MTEQRTLMVVHAHPDDEVFSTGGILARYAAEGARVVVVYGTRGEVGEMHDPGRDADEARARLGEIREAEARQALEILGVHESYFLGYRDSGMKDTEPNADPAAFMNAPFDEAVGHLADLMREVQPQVVVTYDQGGGYGHPDHVMTNRVTAAAFTRAQGQPWAPKKLYYTAGSREGFRRQVEGIQKIGLQIPWIKNVAEIDFDKWGLPDAEITARVDVSPYAPLKKQALAVHRTQIRPDFYYLQVPDEILRDFVGTEYFMRIQPPAAPGEHEDDLFAGLEARTEAA